MQKLLLIQTELKAPKWQFNAFGKYKYRSCEDIVESLKPILKEQNCLLTLSDELVLVWERYYIKATASLTDIDSKEVLLVTGYAREEETKKGMDGSQITGASSSYARKYALNGMFAIDDTKDSDGTNDHGKAPAKDKAPVKAEAPAKKVFDQKKMDNLILWSEDKTKEEVMQFVIKIQKDYEIGDAERKNLDLFLKDLE